MNTEKKATFCRSSFPEPHPLPFISIFIGYAESSSHLPHNSRTISRESHTKKDSKSVWLELETRGGLVPRREGGREEKL